MDAVILAADHGTDLSALTAKTPKHLLPLGNRPYLVYAIEAMRDAGFKRVALTVNGSGPQYQSVLGDGSELGVNLTYARETSPQGTAGCLRTARAGNPDAPVLVMNGNLVLSSEDLRQLLAAHREAKAAVTMGVVPTALAGNGRPQFDRLAIGPEKSLLDMRIDYADAKAMPEYRSAGVYLFERSTLARMPDQGYYDLKEQFIPALLKLGLRVQTHPLSSYVQELNSVEDYLKLQFDLCRGLLGLQSCGEEVMEGVWAQGPVSISPAAMLVGPIILGAGVRIGDGCRLIGPLVVGKDTQIRDGVLLRESVISENVRLGRDSRVEHSVLTADTGVPEGARIHGTVATSAGLSQGALNLVERDLRVGITAMPFRRYLRTRLARFVYCASKRLFDLCFAAGALILLLPLMAVIAIAIRWDSRGPILFRQRRCGKGGKEFVMLKFRSMRADADRIRAKISHLNESDGPVFKINNDPRFTRVGKFLRKYSLDEFPQFWNVLQGDMSIVGPRPLAESELRTCPSWREARLRVKPGLTGLWQVSSREKMDFRDWIQHDLRYVREQSLGLDFKILLRTVTALARGF